MLQKRNFKMKIKSLEEMENIVSKNSNLFWEGWDVYTKIKEDGFYSNEGFYDNNSWLVKKKFSFNGEFWEIPDRFVKNV
jgi:hypothetical protein